MTKRKAADIRADWERATPGKWRMKRGNIRGYVSCEKGTHVCQTSTIFNGRAIANAPTDIDALLDWQERAKEVIQWSLDRGLLTGEDIKQLLEEM